MQKNKVASKNINYIPTNLEAKKSIFFIRSSVTHLMVQIQSDSNACPGSDSNSELASVSESYSTSQPSTLIGLEAKLEGKVLCGALVYQFGHDWPWGVYRSEWNI